MSDIQADPSILQEIQSRKEAKRQRQPSGVGMHKRRSQWFQERAAWPYRDAPEGALVRARMTSMQALAAVPGTETWQDVGPRNIGGRMTCIVSHPQHPDKIWAGAAGGGVWASDDAGSSWRPLWHDQPSLNIGAIAICPNDPKLLYCGTGEANLSADSHPGAGLFASKDGGLTWLPLATPRQHDIPVRIGAIAIDPFDPLHICIGGVGHYYGSENPGGMYTSHDGGLTWKRQQFVSTRSYWCHAVRFHPTRPGVLYVACTEKGRNSGVWRSFDGGKSWQHLQNGLPSAELFGRTSLAISPSQPNVLYAITANDRRGVLGVFQSSDGGGSWRDISGKHFARERQMSYNNTIVVHPRDPQWVLCGGVDLHRTKDGGQTWEQVTDWRAERDKDTNYAHADQHALHIPAARPERIYAMNDGGMDISEDGGDTWSNRSKGLSVTMYYDLDVCQANPQLFGGGTQDNGTLITNNDQPDQHFRITGGDGGWIVFDPQDPNHMFASIYNMNIFRYRGAEGWTDVSPPEDEEAKGRMWMVYIAMDSTQPTRLFTGSNRVWYTQNDGDTWQAVSDSLDDSGIKCIEIARSNPNQIYVGTSNGGFFRSLDGGKSWSGNLAGSTLPGYTITRIKTRPDNADQLLITVANFGQSHVFRSRDAGRTWEDVDQGQLPDVPHHSIEIPWFHPDEVYVANDIGVYVSSDFGDSWRNLSRNLPSTNMVDLVYHNKQDTLTVATYGRSIWRLKVR